MLREIVRGIVASHTDAAERNRIEQSPHGFDLSVEEALGQLELHSAVVDGIASLTTVACVFEELGRSAVATPFTRGLLAFVFLAAARGSDSAIDLLEQRGPRIALGRRRIGENGSPSETVELGWADVADHALVYSTVGGPLLELFPLDEAEYEPLESFDTERTSRVLLEPGVGTALDGTTLSIASGVMSVNLLSAAGLIGLAQGATELTVNYVSQRQQFGQAIGKFQSVQHALADVSIRTTGARLGVYEALWLLEHDKPVDRLSAIAVYQATVASMEATHAAVQFHGGIGHTIDYGLHHYYRRAKAEGIRLGGRLEALQRVAVEIRATPDPVVLRHLPPRVVLEDVAR